MAPSAGAALARTALTLAAIWGGSAHAALDRPYAIRTTYGDVGILEMPSARTAPDGQLSFTAATLDTTQRYSLGFQLLPWLEASFRYSHTALGNGLDNYDRSFGMKVRLWDESEYMPAIAVGVRDLLGDRIYGSEYIVASKQIGPLDATLGLGWGRLAETNSLPNPFGQLSSSFKTRTSTSGSSGTLDFGQLFHGRNVGLFGGVVWHTPVPNLRVLLEYSSDRYNTPLDREFHVRVPVNIGIAYQPLNYLTLTAGWLYGTSYGLTLNITADPTKSLADERTGPAVPLPVARSYSEQMLALQTLAKGNGVDIRSITGGVWAGAPGTPSAPTLAVSEALLSEAHGVHSVEISGGTLMIDAEHDHNPNAQCALYAKVAVAIDENVNAVAITDLSDPNGAVTVCQAVKQAAFRRVTVLSPLLDATDANRAAGGPFAAGSTDARIRSGFAQQGLRLQAVTSEGGEMWVYYDNHRYLFETDAAGRAARVLMADAPPAVEIFHLILVQAGVPTREIRIVRSGLERATLAHGGASEMHDALAIQVPSLDNPALGAATGANYPHFSWSITPSFRHGFVDPRLPLQAQLLVSADGKIELMPGLSINGGFDVNIYNNFDQNYSPGGVLPHVRTDVAKYFKHTIGFSDLNIAYRTRLAPDVLAELKVGYLEDMYAGAGAQVLWRPDGSRFAFGLDIYEVWKRDFDRMLGLQSYHVLTGHASIYYASPWYGLNFNIHAGRYLAGDYGATLEVTRRFATGIEIGAFATFTDVPFSKFGEGSFDKGLVIRIPLEWGLPFYTQSSYDLVLRSLTRDGGQRLDGDDSLYDETRMSGYGEVSRRLDQVVEPQ